MRYHAPLFNRDISLFFFCVGLCSHTIYLLQATWTHSRRRIPSRRRRSRGPESTRSLIRHVREFQLKWNGLTSHLVTRGRLESVGSPSDDNGRTTRSSVSSSDHDCHRTVVSNHDLELTLRHVEGSESSDRHRDVLDRAVVIVHSPEAIGRLAVVAEVF